MITDHLKSWLLVALRVRKRISTLDRLQQLEDRLKFEQSYDDALCMGITSECTVSRNDDIINYLAGYTGGHHGDDY